MQFSLRLVLLLTAYVALVVAAFASGSIWTADLVWVATVLAIAYTSVVAFVSRGKRQAMALGFVILSLACITSLRLEPSRTLAVQAFSMTGYQLTTKGQVYVDTGQGTVRLVQSLSAGARALDAASTLAAGFIGCGLGALAYRQGGVEERADSE